MQGSLVGLWIYSMIKGGIKWKYFHPSKMTSSIRCVAVCVHMYRSVIHLQRIWESWWIFHCIHSLIWKRNPKPQYAAFTLNSFSYSSWINLVELLWKIILSHFPLYLYCCSSYLHITLSLLPDGIVANLFKFRTFAICSHYDQGGLMQTCALLISFIRQDCWLNSFILVFQTNFWNEFWQRLFEAPVSNTGNNQVHNRKLFDKHISRKWRP